MIKALNLQDFLFEKETSRVDLLNYTSTFDVDYRVAIYRNHSFELIENTIRPYLDYANMGVEFLYSSYDDSLAFLELDFSADLVLLWLDLSNYEIDDLQSFIHERIQYLKEKFEGNILFIPYGDNGRLDIESLQVATYSLTRLEEQLADKFLDLRLEPFSGTKLSNVANLEISRDLGLNYLPALLRPNLKGVVVDLDNTLYAGVLGEDGITGVELSDGHRLLQTQLKRLSQQGFFLSIASKNDERDVVQLFKERKDFPLKIEDFVKVHANWDSKADSITSIADSLNISVDSLLFVDDNMGEIVSVLERHPSLNVILAKDNARLTHKVLSNYPGLLKLSLKREDGLRKSDAMANKERQKIQKTLTAEDYIKELDMELLYEINEAKNLERVTELSNKTNQFIFSYQRYSSQQVRQLMKSNDSAVISISLKDKLSDSGIIGVIVVTKKEEFGVLEECFVSCRALGRGVDQAIVLGGTKIAMEHLNIENLKVNFSKGERNFPAERFCNTHFDKQQKSPEEFSYNIPSDLIKVSIK